VTLKTSRRTPKVDGRCLNFLQFKSHPKGDGPEGKH
jgi:hypothetical protein